MLSWNPHSQYFELGWTVDTFCIFDKVSLSKKFVKNWIWQTIKVCPKFAEIRQTKYQTQPRRRIFLMIEAKHVLSGRCAQGIWFQLNVGTRKCGLFYNKQKAWRKYAQEFDRNMQLYTPDKEGAHFESGSDRWTLYLLVISACPEIISKRTQVTKSNCRESTSCKTTTVPINPNSFVNSYLCQF